ncbi:MAG: winged helix-turn-helix domain-containing protein [Acidobacteriota bacterium]|nr:winged helix-turn-helix domain-containing protein [Blastocatellia bacterium]MDW8413256.1 winged helix-turn-helix domain-containing protein [Acidobacteriota bacterium]
MGYKEAAIEVLRKEQRPMTAREIVARATQLGLLQVSGRTPDASLAGRIYTDIQRHGEDSLFVQVGPRTYALREWMKKEPKPSQSKLREYLFKLSFEKLRERLYMSIISLAEEDRSTFIDDLLRKLRLSGANVTNHLLLLGVHSGATEAASASDIALLLRYYRINYPNIFDVAVDVIEKYPELVVNLLPSE